MPTVYYDDSVPTAVRIVQELVPNAIQSCTFLRDGVGRVHVYVPEGMEPAIVAQLDAALKDGLQGYAPSFGPAVRSEQVLGTPSLLVLNGDRIRFIERRFAGTDWAHGPVGLKTDPPRLVFYSVKGGVGRTTALSILATALAHRGLSVLAVDLDPGSPQG